MFLNSGDKQDAREAAFVPGLSIGLTGLNSSAAREAGHSGADHQVSMWSPWGSEGENDSQESQGLTDAVEEDLFASPVI
jgi:hypothetical protein